MRIYLIGARGGGLKFSIEADRDDLAVDEMSPDNLRLHIVFVVYGLRIYLIGGGDSS